jgi:hypothetical protein
MCKDKFTEEVVFDALDSALLNTESITELDNLAARLVGWIDSRTNQLKKFGTLL